MLERKTDVVWPRKEAIPRIRRKKDSGDGTTWEKKKRRPKQTWMDFINRDMRAIGTPSERRKMKSMTEVAGGELCLPQQILVQYFMNHRN